MRDQVEAVYQKESRRILSTLIRLVGDFDLAEDVMQDAFSLALVKWQTEGVPENPRAWIVSVAKFKAIDVIRRQIRTNSSLEDLGEQPDPSGFDISDDCIEDDLLRLIFTCCHPALPADAQVALTLREVCDLTTVEIGKAFLKSPTTIGQRIVRAKAKIREEKIPYVVPDKNDLPERLDNVLRVVYLVFNEGYYASSGAAITRGELTGEAIRIGRLLASLLPESEVLGLLGLMLIQESRRTARTAANGDIVLLDDQDRSQWDQDLIEEGRQLSEIALAGEQVGVYALQSGIASVHASAREPGETNWARIVDFYDHLMAVSPSPVVELNRAVAVAMSEGPEAGLTIVDELLAKKKLNDYGFAHSVRGDFCRRLGRYSDSIESYETALTLASQGPEQRFLQGRIDELNKFVE